MQAGVFSAWVPDNDNSDGPLARTPDESIREVAVDDEGNPLDVLDQLTRSNHAKLEAVDVEYDEWEADEADPYDRGTSQDPSRASTAYHGAHGKQDVGDLSGDNAKAEFGSGKVVGSKSRK